MKRNLKAINLVRAIQRHGVIEGYSVAGQLAGEPDAQPRDWGQVCSLIDYACFQEGLPCLSLFYVRRNDGSFNRESFSESAYDTHQEQIMQNAQDFLWSEADYEKLIRHLSTMESTDANGLWAEVLVREGKTPGYLRYNLKRANDRVVNQQKSLITSA